ncbi:MAG: hypothetical protein LBS87_02620 [Puniceicoccales bacterium]|jgi:hypothetical protein|nr:hypothetical protein [Puniceicoccales bacterium]
MDEDKQYEYVNGELVELSADDVAARMAMEADAAIRAQDDVLNASRRTRNALLSACDWSQLPDASLPPNTVIAYRRIARCPAAT